MGRALFAVGVALVLCFGALGAVIALEREDESIAVDSSLAEDLTRAFALADGEARVVTLDEVTDFPWDRVHIVAEDTPDEVLDRSLGFPFEGELPYDAESGELLVFTRDGEFERFADYRGRLTFEGLQRPITVLDPVSARFRVRDGVIRPTGER